jgi:predicted transcriptional regulator
MTRLTTLFASKTQTRLLEFLLENRGKIFNQASLSHFIDASPSSIARVIRPLIREEIVMLEQISGMKVIALNEESQKTKVLISFFEQMKMS